MLVNSAHVLVLDVCFGSTVKRSHARESQKHTSIQRRWVVVDSTVLDRPIRYMGVIQKVLVRVFNVESLG